MFPKEIRAIIVGYTATWRLLPWISENEINWNYLGANPHPAAVDLILANLDKADWGRASANPLWWPWLREHPELINVEYVASNTHPDAYDYIVSNMDRMQYSNILLAENPIMIPWLKLQRPNDISSYGLCRNIAARELVLANKDNIDWRSLHTNPAPWALKLCEDNPDKYHEVLAINPAGFDLLVKSAKRAGKSMEDFVFYYYLSQNNDPRAIKMMIAKPGRISWNAFSKLPNAVPYFNNNKHKLCWGELFANPGIFELWVQPGLFELL